MSCAEVCGQSDGRKVDRGSDESRGDTVNFLWNGLPARCFSANTNELGAHATNHSLPKNMTATLAEA